MPPLTAAQRLHRFADLAVRVGVNVQPGQDVVVRADLAHAEIARAVVEQAWVAGARRVDVEWRDGAVRRSAVVHGTLDALTETPPWQAEQVRGWGRDGAAVIMLAGDPDPHLLDGLDPARVAASPHEFATLYRASAGRGDIAWTIVAAPNPGWATQVFGEPDVERLWDAVAVAMRLDEDDPVDAWREQDERLSARAAALDALELTSIRYTGPGTDLTAGLVPNTRWTGGGVNDSRGIPTMPNIPTEEVFTSPDRRLADGHITVTKPLVLPGGVLVEDLKVTFERGRVVEATARAGAEAVRAQLDTDDGARSLGEVSLVDSDSRISRAGIVFHNTLFDENAGCHVAWGASFPFAVDGGTKLAPEDLHEIGLNRSVVHTDVVIGGRGITVVGTSRRGDTEIIRADEWVLPVG